MTTGNHNLLDIIKSKGQLEYIFIPNSCAKCKKNFTPKRTMSLDDALNKMCKVQLYAGVFKRGELLYPEDDLEHDEHGRIIDCVEFSPI